MDFCNILRLIRKHNDLHIYLASYYTGFSIRKIREIEGRKRIPTLEDIEVFSKVYNIDAKELNKLYIMENKGVSNRDLMIEISKYYYLLEKQETFDKILGLYK